MANLEIYNFDHVVCFSLFAPLSITSQVKQLISSISGSNYLPCQRLPPLCQKIEEEEKRDDLPNDFWSFFYSIFSIPRVVKSVHFANEESPHIGFGLIPFLFLFGCFGRR